MSAAARKQATFADLEALPANVIGQIVLGVLHAHPRPAVPHALAASALGEELGPPFKRGRGGPGGWLILDEPELHLADDVLVPDLAGWRRDWTMLGPRPPGQPLPLSAGASLSGAASRPVDVSATAPSFSASAGAVWPPDSPVVSTASEQPITSAIGTATRRRARTACV